MFGLTVLAVPVTLGVTIATGIIVTRRLKTSVTKIGDCCSECRYSLAGLSSGARCPECGLDNAAAYEVMSKRRAIDRERLFRLAIIGLTVAAIAYLLIPIDRVEETLAWYFARPQFGISHAWERSRTTVGVIDLPSARPMTILAAFVSIPALIRMPLRKGLLTLACICLVTLTLGLLT